MDVGEDQTRLQALLTDLIGLGNGLAAHDIAAAAREEVDDLIAEKGVVLYDQDFIRHE